MTLKRNRFSGNLTATLIPHTLEIDLTAGLIKVSLNIPRAVANVLSKQYKQLPEAGRRVEIRRSRSGRVRRVLEINQTVESIRHIETKAYELLNEAKITARLAKIKALKEELAFMGHVDDNEVFSDDDLPSVDYFPTPDEY